jgi:pimeloyl-ACP methyl ester carboxylesterase
MTIKRATLDGAEIEYEVQGNGEPVLLIHGSLLADSCRPLLTEPDLTRQFQIIHYHRRGYAGSSRVQAARTMNDWARDADILLQHLKIADAHVVGQSYGGAIALQLTLDRPERVRSLALLEPPLQSWVPSGPGFWTWLDSAVQVYTSGDKTGVTQTMLEGLMGPNYQDIISRVLPPGAFEQAIVDCDTFFQFEAQTLRQWQLSPQEVGGIRVPVLSMLGTDTMPVFREVNQLIKQWHPAAAEATVPRGTHMLPISNPTSVAANLAAFFSGLGR